MAAAHLDEIAFIITHVDSDGYAHFHTLGGFDPKTLTARACWCTAENAHRRHGQQAYPHYECRRPQQGAQTEGLFH
ncbi:MAG: hypothetical protein R3B47_18885 [Bacteroidia bacterium]